MDPWMEVLCILAFLIYFIIVLSMINLPFCDGEKCVKCAVYLNSNFMLLVDNAFFMTQSSCQLNHVTPQPWSLTKPMPDWGTPVITPQGDSPPPSYSTPFPTSLHSHFCHSLPLTSEHTTATSCYSTHISDHLGTQLVCSSLRAFFL